MKFKYTFASLVMIIYSINTLDPNCTINNCPKHNGECIENICLCGAGYTTIESTQNLKESTDFKYCNYDYKYNEYAAYFEALFPFGVGHFYAHRFMHAIFKFLLFWFVSFNRIVFKKTIKLFPCIEKINIYTLWLFALAYVFDYLAFTLNIYTDGKGIALL